MWEEFCFDEMKNIKIFLFRKKMECNGENKCKNRIGCKLVVIRKEIL